MTAPTVRVLFVEDLISDAELELRELKRAGLRVVHRIVEAEQSFVAALREFSPDVILSDFSMPSFDGMSALSLAREMCPDVPFIFVSATIGEEYAIRALKNGATDYVLKTNLVRLPAAVERALAEAKERRDRRRIEVELELARERTQSIIDAMPDMLWSVKLPGENLIFVGPASKKIFGRNADDFLRDPELWTGLVHPEDRARMLESWRALVLHGEPFDVEYRVLRPDGAEAWVSDRGHAVRNAAGGAERIDGVVRDITEQVEHRRRIARLSRVREFVSAINLALVRLRNREALFTEICRVAVDVGGFSGAHVGLLEHPDRDVRWVASSGTGARWQTGAASGISAREDESGSGIVGRSLRAAQPAVWNDVAEDPGVRDRELLLGSGIRALGSFPLVVEARVVGTLCLDAREKCFFDADEMRLLQEVAANVSFALELIEKQDRITYLALYDPLTGLPNRALLRERLTQAIEVVQRSAGKLALAIYDLQRFKAINDTFGQHIGDRVLQAVAQRVLRPVKDVNRVARLGGNVFALLIPGVSGAEEVARQLEEAAARFFAEPFEIDGHELRLAARAGIALYPDDGHDADTLFRNAEAALKHAKETRESQVFYTAAINARVAEQVQLEHRLRKAVERGELFLHFQPKLDLVTRRIVGLEALMRWQPPEGGPMSPAKFVPVLEQTGLILEAGRQVIAAATRTFRGWQARGLTPARIAVNVSALQLRRKSFVAEVRAALGEAGSDGGGVDLEITESLLMDDVDESIRKLHELRELGMRIALDDFGTGYSSLAYLSKLPLDTVKIDRGFVSGMTENPDDTSIVSTITSLAQALRFKVVAEGVETEQQAQLLRLLRCDQVQGYLFSPPLPLERIEALLETSKTT